MIFAPVEEVCVYRNGAVVRRKALVGLKRGENEVILSGLGRSADPDSLRLFFPEGVVGRDVQIVPFGQAGQPLPSARLNDEIDAAQSRIDALKTMEELWIGNGRFTGCAKETVEEYLEALPSRLEALRTEKRTLEKKLSALQQEKAKLEKKENVQVVRLLVTAASDLEADCVMEYAERSAGWRSTYEIRTDADSEELSVVCRARITQNTGEDWQNVLVRLYTGSPTDRQEIPSLQKLSLRFPQPIAPPSVNRAAAPRFLADLGCAASDMAEAPMPMLAMEEAEETDDETMTGYALPGRRTVPSGAVGTVADLKTTAVPAKKRIVCVPRADDRAYLAAMVKTADWPLKPSSAKIYLNENYCGEIYVAPDLTEETFMISLGRDERIEVSRETVRSFTEDLLLKGLKRRTSEYAIRVVNRQEKPLRVLVRDQIPVSTEKQIAVERVSADGASVDEQTGKLVWNLTVGGKAAVEKRLSYAVTYPKEKTPQEIRSNEKDRLKVCPRCGAYAEGKTCPECGGAI